MEILSFPIEKTMMSRIVYEGGTGEIEEKKSRFIATVRPVHTEEEALAFIAGIKKKYWDARHNCYAYVIGENAQLMRCSDDGEPQGTAGRPMLDVLTGAQITDAAVVVTRYFGGTLLGTGGLVRAYSRAVGEGLAASRVLEQKSGICLGIRTNYTDLGKIQYLLGQEGLYTLQSEYGEQVSLTVLVPAERIVNIEEMLTEATGARAVFTSREEIRYAAGEKVPVLLDEYSRQS